MITHAPVGGLFSKYQNTKDKISLVHVSLRNDLSKHGLVYTGDSSTLPLIMPIHITHDRILPSTCGAGVVRIKYILFYLVVKNNQLRGIKEFFTR